MNGFYEPLKLMLAKAEQEGFMKEPYRDALVVSSDPSHIVDLVGRKGRTITVPFSPSLRLSCRGTTSFIRTRPRFGNFNAQSALHVLLVREPLETEQHCAHRASVAPAALP